eukprot:5601786-Lingulodinium_polyedra.AAC.1
MTRLNLCCICVAARKPHVCAFRARAACAWSARACGFRAVAPAKIRFDRVFVQRSTKVAQ